jgi:beta-N-acetylhexosaminidase
MPIDDRGMNELINDIKPYVYLMNKHLDAIMTAHIHYPLIDESITTFSKHWLKTILRQELGFNGLIFSDDLMMKAVNTELNMDEKINHALSAGCDFVLVCNMESQMSDLLDDLDLNINESEMSAKINTLRCKSINKGMIKHSFRELTLKLNHLLDSL